MTSSIPSYAREPDAEGTLRRVRLARRVPGGGIMIATALLFLVAWILVPNSVRLGAVSGMLPYAAILILVALGQTLVVQQGGIDLSVAGVISLSGVVAAIDETVVGPAGLSLIVLAIVLTGLLSGLAAGLLITRLGVAPIVSTLAMNSILYGIDIAISGGTPGSVPDAFSDFANVTLLGITVLVFLAVGATICVAFVVRKTVVGRRFEVVGASSRVARAAGIGDERFKVCAYMASGFLSAVAGALLASLMKSPSAFQGDTYLMSSIAAVVLGGTSLLGGTGNYAATAVAALFLTQLQLLVLTTGAPIGVQYLFQGTAILLGVLIYNIDLGKWVSRGSTPR